MFRRIAQGRAFGLGLALFAASAGAGCDKVRAKVKDLVCEPAARGAATPPAAAGSGAAAAQADEHQETDESSAGAAAPADQAAAPQLTAGAKFALPFAWEKSPAEPLSRARTFLRELADDNAAYMKKGAAFFRAFQAQETPRATVLTCTDSRVQSSAFDATAENDDYTVRNLGNQVESGLGSVQYGVDQLHTPVLLILGHTGCDAVKRAITSMRGLDEPVRQELSGLKLKRHRGKLDDKRWAAAVEENVHDQVKAALRRFGARVTAGELTIVGAIYDLRNDLGRGPGKLIVVDVNGNRDETRLKAFGDAILSAANPNGKPVAPQNPLDRLAKALAESANFGDDEEFEDYDGHDGADDTRPLPSALPASRAHH